MHNNLEFCDEVTRRHVRQVLESPTTQNLVKTVLNSALEKDGVDAYHDAQLAADLLREVCDSILFEYQSTDVKPPARG